MTRILILDDRPINRQFLTTLLAYKGFETREAGNGIEGLKAAEEWTPDLAIVDIRMPGMDGIEFVRRLRADPKLASVPIIFYTASYEASDAQRIARECGVAHVLMKPSEPQVILDTIDEALGRPAESRVPPTAVAATTEFERLQSGAMRMGALIDFQLEIAEQRNPDDILRILSRAARNVVTSEHSVVNVGDATFAGCDHPPCSDPPDAAAGPAIRVALETATRHYGWLTLRERHGGGEYTADDQRIVLTIAAQAAMAYENLLLIEEIRREAGLLERNVNLLRATIEASSDGILVVDRDSRYVTYNQRFVEIWRIPAEVLSSGDTKRSADHALTLVKDRDAFRAVLDAAAATREAAGTFETNDGRFIECHDAPRIFEGEVIGRVWSFRDVTLRVCAEDGLRQSEEKYRSLIANIPDVVWTANASGLVSFISDNVEALYGFTAEEVHDNGEALWQRRVHPDDVPRVTAAYAALFQKRQPFDCDYRVQRKNGSWIWVHGSSVETYERDGVLYADGIIHDITARKQTEKELRRVARDRKLLLESTGDGVCAADDQGRCTMANRVAASLVGRTIGEMIGSSLHDLIHHHRADGTPYPAEECAMENVLRTGKPVRATDDVFWRKDGSSFPVEYVCSPIVDQGVIRGAVVTFTDVTERRQLERRLEQVDRIDSLGRMAATIAHEFNNVLMGIQPFAEVIRRNAGSDQALQKAADHIMSSVARGKNITKDILRVSNAAEPQVRSFDLIPWLDQLVSEIRVLVGALVHVELDVPSWDALFVRCDPAQMQQVLTNLAVNARDAMGGNGTLRIAAERVGILIRMVVADTGCGIAPATLPYIFEPLFTTKHSGTGLGLAVAQQIVLRNGGTIGVESTMGEGTRFQIDLHSAPPPDRAASDAGLSTDQQLGIRCVLIVEDEPSVASGLEAILEAEGVEVHVVGRGAEASAAVARFGPDAILLDMSLPDMSGAVVYEEIAARWPDLPVIFSTGHAGESRLPQWSSKHVGFLRKPYSSEVLLTKLREVVRITAPSAKH